MSVPPLPILPLVLIDVIGSAIPIAPGLIVGVIGTNGVVVAADDAVGC